MRVFIWILSSSFACLPNLTLAYPDCTPSDARYIYPQCAQQLLKSSEAELDALYETLLGELDKDRKETLRAAQESWEKFRENDISLQYATSGEGGSLAAFIALNHKIDLTIERIKHIESFTQPYLSQSQQ